MVQLQTTKASHTDPTSALNSPTKARSPRARPNTSSTKIIVHGGLHSLCRGVRVSERSPSALQVSHKSCPADSNRPEHQKSLGTSPDEMPFLGCDEAGFATLALGPSRLYSLWLRAATAATTHWLRPWLGRPDTYCTSFGKSTQSITRNTTRSPKRPS